MLILVDTAERPEEIDAKRAKRDADAAKEALLQKKSIQEYRARPGYPGPGASAVCGSSAGPICKRCASNVKQRFPLIKSDKTGMVSYKRHHTSFFVGQGFQSSFQSKDTQLKNRCLFLSHLL